MEQLRVFVEDGFAIDKGAGIGQYTLNLFQLLKTLPEIEDVQLVKKPFLARIPSPALRRASYILWLNAGMQLLLWREQPHMIHFANYLVPSLRLSGAKYVVTVHDLAAWKFPETLPSTYVPYIRRTITHAIKTADLVLTISNTIKEEIIEIFGIRDKKIHVAYALISRNFWTVPKIGTSEAIMIKNKFGIKKDFLLFVGAIEERKNVITLVKAFNLLKNSKDIQLVLVGSPGYGFWEVEKYLEEMHLKSEVIFTGYISEKELISLYDMAIAFVYPSLYEGFGMPLVEAMARGTPIVASKIPSTEEIVGDSAVYYSQSLAHEKLAEKILKVLENNDLRRGLAEKGMKRAQAFSWEVVGRQYLRSYMKIVEKS